MKKTPLLIITIIAVGLLTTLSSCRTHCINGSGNQITIKRKIADFKRLEISDSFKVRIKQDSSSVLTITADDNIIKYIKTVVNGDKLRIYTRQNMCNSGEIVINVPIKIIEEIRATDAAEVLAEGKVNARDLYFKVSDGAQVTMDVTAVHLITHLEDAGELNLKGQASANEIEISNGSKLNATDFVSGTCTVQASDAAYCEVNVLNNLSVRASDGAVVKYHGNPPSVNASKSDGASVDHAN